MHIRCGSCHGAFCVEMAQVAERVSSVTCPTCGKEYRLEGGRDAEGAAERLAEEARQLVLETQVDLPSAYSVLLGVTSLEEVLELGDASSPACQTAPEETSRGHGRMHAYDPAYQPAVDAGLLTPLQAMQRGRRESYASIVTRRYRVPEEMALEVADNRISLLEALRRRGPDPGPPVALTVEPPSRRRSRVPWVIVLALVALVGTFVVLQGPTKPAPTIPNGGTVRSVLGAEVRFGEGGRVLRVAGPDPRSVLSAYCAADPQQRYEPVGVVPSQERPAARLGLLRRAGHPEETLSIVLLQDRAGKRWVAGDGTSPALPNPAPHAAAVEGP